MAINRGVYHKGGNSKLYDEIWILRFVLSHKSNVKKATNAALATMKFREEKKLNELGDIHHRIKTWVPPKQTSSGSQVGNCSILSVRRMLFSTFYLIKIEESFR